MREEHAEILVVDDDGAYARTLTEWLQNRIPQVVTYTDDKDKAIELVKSTYVRSRSSTSACATNSASTAPSSPLRSGRSTNGSASSSSAASLTGETTRSRTSCGYGT